MIYFETVVVMVDVLTESLGSVKKINSVKDDFRFTAGIILNFTTPQNSELKRLV